MPLYASGGSGSSQLSSYTLANRPSAASMSGQAIIVSDVGINGSIWYSNGSKWIHESPIIYQLDSSGWLSPSLAAANAATYSQTGTTITVTSTAHALNSLSNGCKVFLNIASGLATAGWYDNFTFVDANTFTCVSAISQSTTGTINTNLAATVVTPATKTILGGLMGLNGAIRVAVHATNLNDAGIKTLALKLAGTNYFSGTVTTGVGFFVNSRIVNNRNSESAQITQPVGNYTGGANVGRLVLAVNTANDFDHSIALTCAAANEYVRIESILIEILPN
jgi:hypothetical protein